MLKIYFYVPLKTIETLERPVNKNKQKYSNRIPRPNSYSFLLCIKTETAINRYARYISVCIHIYI